MTGREMREDCLLLVDVFGNFRHEDGEALLASFRERFPALLGGRLHAAVADPRGLRLERGFLAGMSTEGCVAQIAIAAREEGTR